MQNHTLSLSRQVKSPTHCTLHTLLLIHCESFQLHRPGARPGDVRFAPMITEPLMLCADCLRRLGSMWM